MIGYAKEAVVTEVEQDQRDTVESKSGVEQVQTRQAQQKEPTVKRMDSGMRVTRVGKDGGVNANFDHLLSQTKRTSSEQKSKTIQKVGKEINQTALKEGKSNRACKVVQNLSPREKAKLEARGMILDAGRQGVNQDDMKDQASKENDLRREKVARMFFTKGSSATDMAHHHKPASAIRNHPDHAKMLAKDRQTGSNCKGTRQREAASFTEGLNEEKVPNKEMSMSKALVPVGSDKHTAISAVSSATIKVNTSSDSVSDVHPPQDAPRSLTIDTDAPVTSPPCRAANSSSPVDVYGENLQSPAQLSVAMNRDLAGVSLHDLDVITTIGAGSFGVVKLVAHQKHRGHTMALKVLSKDFISKMRQKKQVMREAAVYKTIDHPNIAHLYATFQDADHLYMLMEFCGGGELFTMLYEESSPLTHGDGGMPDHAVRFYMANVILALAYLHNQDTVYRDLKMENLVLNAKGYPKLVDLGFAKILPNDARTYTKCGSPDYMAPELHLGKAHGKPVDVWAFGVILFEMLTGTTPFFDKNPQQIVRKVVRVDVDWPKGFRKNKPVAANLIDKLLVRDPEKRCGVKQALKVVRKNQARGSGDKRLISCSGGINPMEGLKAHAFFDGVAWAVLQQQTQKPPFVPELDDSRDCCMFPEFSDSDDEDDAVPYTDDGTGWSEGF